MHDNCIFKRQDNKAYLSAYDLAVKQGFRGSLKEWLKSLKGEQGDIGPEGPKGDTPVKGTDYFTPEEVSDIESAATAAAVEEVTPDIEAVQDDLDTHKADTTKHITAEERSTWNAKQDAISDLADIRSGAELGATSLQEDEKGEAGGVAELDSSGKVPSSQLPSYVDDVLEYASISAFPATGESGKIYVTLDTNKTYRWSGSAYVEISASLVLGETSSTAYRGDRGKTAYEHSQDGSVHVTAAQKAEWSGKQDALPTAILDRVLHTNASTGALEWIKRDVWAFDGNGIPTGGDISTALQDGRIPVFIDLSSVPYRGIYICYGGEEVNDTYRYFFVRIANNKVRYYYKNSGSVSHQWDGQGDYNIITQHQSLSAYRTSAAQDVIDAEKQDTLVSGENIATINGNDLLEGGDIEVSGLPPVTSANEGSIPMVVNGTWQVVKTWIEPEQSGGEVTIQSVYQAVLNGSTLEVA